jgi:thioredoxin-related protein
MLIANVVHDNEFASIGCASFYRWPLSTGHQHTSPARRIPLPARFYQSLCRRNMFMNVPFYDRTVKTLASALLACLVLFVCCAALAAEIQWETDFNAALQKAAAQKKPMMVDLYTSWCGWCKVLDQKTYSDPGVIEQAKNFISVKVDGDKQRDLISRYNITGYPTILFLDDTGKETYRIVGFRPPEKFLPPMKAVAQHLDPEAEMKNLIASNPSDWESLLRIANYYMEKGQTNEALDSYQKALAKIPANKQKEREDATFALAQLYFEKQKLDDAEKLLLDLEKQPNVQNPTMLQQLLIAVYLSKADKAKTLEHLNKLRPLITDDATRKQLDTFESQLDTMIAQMKKMRGNVEEVEAQPAPGATPEQDAEMRARVAKTKANMRTVATGLEAYFIDNNTYPASVLGSDALSAFAPYPELKERYSFRNYVRGSAFSLTSPISYITSSMMTDPFSPDEKENPRPFSYYGGKKNSWILISPGPDGNYDINPERDYHGFETTQVGPEDSLLIKAYDPTNGSVSSGDIFRIKQ